MDMGSGHGGSVMAPDANMNPMPGHSMSSDMGLGHRPILGAGSGMGIFSSPSLQFGFLQKIIAAIAGLFADIIDRGIVLAGGGALLKNLDKRIREETGLPVCIADDPLCSVVFGTGKILSNFKLLRKISVE
jgi:hypothetical protein